MTSKKTKREKERVWISVEHLKLESPYVEEYFQLHGFYPTLKLKYPNPAPERYYDHREGTSKFRMKTLAKETILHVDGIEEGKKEKFNIVCHPVYPALVVYVLLPSFVLKNCWIERPPVSGFDMLAKKIEAANSRMAEILEKRRKGAIVTI